jgi:hypothetical protein
MNDQDKQINLLSKHPVMQLIGICTLYGLENTQKNVLFGTLSVRQKKAVDILIDLLEDKNPSFDDFLFQVTYQLKRIGNVSGDIQHIIYKMRELVQAYAAHHGLEDDYTDDFRIFIQEWRHDAPFNGDSYAKFITRKEPLYKAVTTEHILRKLDILISALERH